MKSHYRTEQGSALMIALNAAAVMGIVLMSYLSLTNAQNQSVARSQSWNSVIPVAEAGIEEALAQLYYSSTNLAANGWTSNANNVFTRSRTIGDGRYVAMISNASPPVIFSTGFSKAPLTGSLISRTIKVNTRKGSPFAQGLVAKGRILFSGGGSLDSFDSSDPSYSTGGQYDPAKRKSGGKLVTNSRLADAIHVDTAHIYGAAFAGPGGTTTVNSGAVGDLAWNASNSGVQAGCFADNANVSFPDVEEPFTSLYFIPASGTVGSTNYTYVVLPGNNKLTGNINIGGGKSMIVTGGDAVLYVDGTFTVGGSGFLYIAPGASLKLYLNGTGTISGTGIVNATQQANNLAIYGLNTCATLTYSGSSTFVGTVYAPYAAFTFSGSSGACGAFTANTATISGGAAIHCDEGLGKDGGLYVVTSWNEI
jgi:Tfp pilus assembly protein PilX